MFKSICYRINGANNLYNKFYRNVHLICLPPSNSISSNLSLILSRNYRNRLSYLKFARFQNIPVRFRATKTSPQNLFEYFDQLDPSIFKSEINQQRPSQLKFVQYENLFAYFVLKNIDNYRDSIAHIFVDCPPVDSRLLLDLDKLIRTCLHNLDEDVSPLVESINKQICRMNEMEIIVVLTHLLKSLPVYQNASDWSKLFLDSPLKNVYQTLDRTSAKLFLSSDDSDETLRKMFAISGLWFEIGLSRNFEFNRILIRKILESKQKPNKLSLIHLMFCVNLQRSIFPSQVLLVSSKVDSFLNQPDSSPTLDELSIIAMGYFKTQTRMPYRTLVKFIEHLKLQLHHHGDQTCNTISVVSCLKLIRFSLDSIQFDARLLKNDIQSLVHIICNENPNLLNSSICLTHLIGMLNSAFLHNSKKLYKIVFDKLIINLDTFRIKDIERILFCLANVMFRCPASKLNQLENYLIKSDQSQIYPYHIYNITLFLLTINYYPFKLIQLCCDPTFLQKSIETSKLNLYNTVLLTDTIIRLELPDNNKSILSPSQIDQFKQNQEKIKISHSKKERFLKSISDSLSEHFGSNFRMMYLFAFSLYPFPVILNDEMRDLLRTENNDRQQSDSIFGKAVFPYTFEHIKEDYFKNCTAILLLMNKDFNYNHSVRGPIHVTRRLLERIGFEVVELRQQQLKEARIPEKGDQMNENYSQQVVIDLILKEIDQQTKQRGSINQHFN